MRDNSRKAPKGKYRVIGVDTFDGTDWREGDFDTKADAIAHAKKRGGEMLKMYVYDDQGVYISSAGSF